MQHKSISSDYAIENSFSGYIGNSISPKKSNLKHKCSFFIQNGQKAIQTIPGSKRKPIYPSLSQACVCPDPKVLMLQQPNNPGHLYSWIQYIQTSTLDIQCILYTPPSHHTHHRIYKQNCKAENRFHHCLWFLHAITPFYSSWVRNHCS